MSERRFLGPSVAFAILIILGAGIFLKIRGSASADSGAGGADSTGLPDVSAAETFNTDMAVPVVGVEVRLDTLVISVTAAAEAAPWRVSRVLAQVEGTVQQILVRENQRVQAGELLLGLDTVDLALEVESARAQLSQAEAQFRELTLFDDAIDDPEIRAERERNARARSGLGQSEVALTQAEINLARTRVGAPFAGRVANVEISEGHRVRVGDELMTVVDIDPIRVEVQVLEAQVGYLQENRSAQVTFAAFPGETFVGRVASINPLIASESRTARVSVLIPNPNGRILPGMYARVSIEARRFPDRIIVPKSAILERDRRTMLFVFESRDGATGLAKWTYVTTGLENDSLVELVETSEHALLDPGQIVLTDGHYTLIHDATVQLEENLRGVEGRPR
jgi:RND family efflux transporter MFP subunit